MNVSSYLVPACIGCAAAVATSIAISQPTVRAEKRDAEKDLAQSAAPIVHQTRVLQTDSHRLGAIETRLDELETSRGGEDEDFDEEAAREEAQALFVELQESFSREPVDQQWAPVAGRALLTGLNSFAESAKFSVVDVQCKTERCRGTVEFDDYSSAQANAYRLSHEAIDGLNCRQAVSLPVPDDPADPLLVDVHLDCARQRAGLTD